MNPMMIPQPILFWFHCFQKHSMDRSSCMTRGVLYHRRLLPVDRLAVSFKMKLVAPCWTVLLIEKVCFRLSPTSSNQNPCHCELLSVCHHQSHVTLDLWAVKVPVSCSWLRFLWIPWRAGLAHPALPSLPLLSARWTSLKKLSRRSSNL